MEKLPLFNEMGKDAIGDAIAKGEWVDGKILTRHRLRQLRAHLAQMPEPAESER